MEGRSEERFPDQTPDRIDVGADTGANTAGSGDEPEENQRKGAGHFTRKEPDTQGDGLSQENGSDEDVTVEDVRCEPCGQGKQEEEEGEEEEEQETQRNIARRRRRRRQVKDSTPKTLETPKTRTSAEREAHDATHSPYQPWCRACVRGRGRNCQHLSISQE